ARGPGDAPEIDGMVHLEPDPSVRPGDFLEVQITHADEHDLWARRVPD
ncbi:MAG: 30S ribosomal protein S12 methylthiotransferase RimO, partial [Gammaproteobacteria bacterium]